jgi:hypothetical protein
MWTLDNALPLIRKISPIARRHGFSVALYGSVLDQGETEKDLDLFFIEQEPDISDVQGCLDEIARLPQIDHCGDAIACTGGTLCVIWLSDPKRYVDAQFRVLR